MQHPTVEDGLQLRSDLSLEELDPEENEAWANAVMEALIPSEHRNRKRKRENLVSIRLPFDRGLAEAAYHSLVTIARQYELDLAMPYHKKVDLDAPGDVPPHWQSQPEFPAMLPGHFISFAQVEANGHQLGGHRRVRGGGCPNCRRPLPLHLLIDTSDPRLGLANIGVRSLPLLFCMRCELGYGFEFVYRVTGDDSIKIIKYNEGTDEGYEQGWREEMGGDNISPRHFSLVPIPSRVQQLFDKTEFAETPADEPTTEEQAELKSALRRNEDRQLWRADHLTVC